MSEYGESASTFSYFYQNANSYTFSGSSDIASDGDKASDLANHLTKTKPWIPSYNYSLESYSSIKSYIPYVAGTDKEGYSKKVTVNGITYKVI